MATQADVAEVEVDEEDLSKLSPAESYASAKHQAIRKWLGIGNQPRKLPPLKWVPNEDWRNFEDFRRSLPPARERTPEWEALVDARKQRAQAELDFLYVSKTASSTESRMPNANGSSRTMNWTAVLFRTQKSKV